MKDTIQKYELTFVLRTGESEEIITSVLNEFGADIVTTGPMQDVSLAYPVKKSSTGKLGYYHFTVKVADALRQIDEKLKLNDRLLRHIIVRVEDKKPRSERTGKPRAAKKATTKDIQSVTPEVSHLDTLSNEKLEKTLEEILK